MDMDQEMLAELDKQFGDRQQPAIRPVAKSTMYSSRSKLNRMGMRLVYDPDHPLANTRAPYKGWVLEHRKLCWDAGLMTDPTQQVRHVNKIVDDNRLENLEVRGTTPKCPRCGNVNRTDGELCQACQVKAERRQRFRLYDSIPVQIDDDLKQDIKNLCFGVVASYLQPYFRRSIGLLVQKREKAVLQEVLSLVDESSDLDELRRKVANIMHSREAERRR